MTDTMKAIVLTKFGGFDAFEMRDVAVPAVGPRQVRVGECKLRLHGGDGRETTGLVNL